MQEGVSLAKSHLTLCAGGIKKNWEDPQKDSFKDGPASNGKKKKRRYNLISPRGSNYSYLWWGRWCWHLFSGSLRRLPRESRPLPFVPIKKQGHEVHINMEKPEKGNDGFSWLMKWLHDCVIQDMIWLASSSFYWLKKVDFYWRTDRPTDRLTFL